MAPLPMLLNVLFSLLKVTTFSYAGTGRVVESRRLAC